MIYSTICHIEKDGKWLMLLRNKKKNDLNEGKWIGIGGKREADETMEECCIRECLEETGLTVIRPEFHGVVHFRSDKWEAEEMYVYTAPEFTGELNEDCSEGTLRWIPKEDILSLNLWAGDRLFLTPLLTGGVMPEMTLRYVGDDLVEHYEGPEKEQKTKRRTAF